MHLTKRMLSLLLALFFTLLLPLYCFAASNLSPATTITDGAYLLYQEQKQRALFRCRKFSQF